MAQQAFMLMHTEIKRLICLFHKRVFLVLLSVGLMMPAGCGNSKPVVIERPLFNAKEAVVFELDEEHKNITKDTSCSVEPVVYESDISELGYIKAPKNEKGEFVVSKGVYKTEFSFSCQKRKEIESATIYVENELNTYTIWNNIPSKIFVKYSIISNHGDIKDKIFTDNPEIISKYFDFPIKSCQYTKKSLNHQAFIRFLDQTTIVSIYPVQFNTYDFCYPLFKDIKPPRTYPGSRANFNQSISSL